MRYKRCITKAEVRGKALFLGRLALVRFGFVLLEMSEHDLEPFTG